MRPAPIIAAIIFAIVAVGQAVRYFNRWDVMINGTDIPLWVSLGGIIVPALMAIWLFFDSQKGNPPKTSGFR